MEELQPMFNEIKAGLRKVTVIDVLGAAFGVATLYGFYVLLWALV